MINYQMSKNRQANPKSLEETLRVACKKIAPVWPLENYVAVNPYLGLADLPFDEAAHRLSQLGAIQMTFPLSFYLEAIEKGKIQVGDVEAVLEKRGSTVSAHTFIRNVEKVASRDEESYPEVASFTDMATSFTGKDWNRFVTDRITSWAAAYFDEGQAIWSSVNRKESVFRAWRREALTDRTPAMMGLTDFRQLVRALPDGRTYGGGISRGI